MCDRIAAIGEALRMQRGAAARGHPRVVLYRAKGGDSVERIIKLVKAITDLIRAITELIRIFKA